MEGRKGGLGACVRLYFFCGECDEDVGCVDVVRLLTCSNGCPHDGDRATSACAHTFSYLFCLWWCAPFVSGTACGQSLGTGTGASSPDSSRNAPSKWRVSVRPGRLVGCLLRMVGVVGVVGWLVGEQVTSAAGDVVPLLRFQVGTLTFLSPSIPSISTRLRRAGWVCGWLRGLCLRCVLGGMVPRDRPVSRLRQAAAGRLHPVPDRHCVQPRALHLLLLPLPGKYPPSPSFRFVSSLIVPLPFAAVELACSPPGAAVPRR